MRRRMMMQSGGGRKLPPGYTEISGVSKQITLECSYNNNNIGTYTTDFLVKNWLNNKYIYYTGLDNQYGLNVRNVYLYSRYSLYVESSRKFLTHSGYDLLGINTLYKIIHSINKYSIYDSEGNIIVSKTLTKPTVFIASKNKIHLGDANIEIRQFSDGVDYDLLSCTNPNGDIGYWNFVTNSFILV